MYLLWQDYTTSKARMGPHGAQFFRSPPTRLATLILPQVVRAGRRPQCLRNRKPTGQAHYGENAVATEGRRVNFRIGLVADRTTRLRDCSASDAVVHRHAGERFVDARTALGPWTGVDGKDCSGEEDGHRRERYEMRRPRRPATRPARLTRRRRRCSRPARDAPAGSGRDDRYGDPPERPGRSCRSTRRRGGRRRSRRARRGWPDR